MVLKCKGIRRLSKVIEPDGYKQHEVTNKDSFVVTMMKKLLTHCKYSEERTLFPISYLYSLGLRRGISLLILHY